MKKHFSQRYYEITLLIGLACLIVFGINSIVVFLPDYVAGLFLGMGVSLLLLSLWILRSKKLMKRLKTIDHDEREQYIQAKSFTTIYFIHIILSVVCIIICGFFEQTKLFSILCAGLLFIEVIIMNVIRYIYSKKY